MREPICMAHLQVYACTVDTVFVCAMKDKDEYGSAHMSEELRDTLGFNRSASLPAGQHSEAQSRQAV